MRQYASHHIDAGDVPLVRELDLGDLAVSVGHGSGSLSAGFLFAEPDILRAFCASIIAQIDALEGGDAA